MSTTKRNIYVAKEVLGRAKGGLHTDRVMMISEFSEMFNDLVPNIVIDTIINVTYSELKILKTNSELLEGNIYRITDRFNYQSNGIGTVPNTTMLGDDRGIVYVKALTSSTLSKEAVRIMLCPTTYATAEVGTNTWMGVWSSYKSFGNNELAIRGARVFRNLGNDPVGIAPAINNLDTINWSLISKSTFANGEYVDKQFSCLYDFDNDWFELQWDGSKNIMGYSFNDFSYLGDNYNPIDISDWNFETLGFLFYNNKLMSFYNNAIIGNVTDNIITYAIRDNYNISGDISSNKCTEITNNRNNGQILNNTIKGGIYNNSNQGDITYNINNGSIDSNDNAGNIIFNRNNGDISTNHCGDVISNNSNEGDIAGNNSNAIRYNSNSGSINYNIAVTSNIDYNSNKGSIFSNNISINIINNTDECGDINGLTGLKITKNNFYNTSPEGYEIDITGASSIDLGGLDIVGIVYLTSSNATEIITSFVSPVQGKKVKILCETGLAVTFVHNPLDIQCEGGVSAVINGDNGDWVEFESTTSNVLQQTNIGTY